MNPLRQLASFVEALEPRALFSKIIYVDANVPGPISTGTSWSTAFTDLQDALMVASSGDQIRVADGTYLPATNTNRNATFQLKDGVKLFGGYAGSGAGASDVRDVAAYHSILSGDIGVAGDASDNSYHVVSAANLGANTLLDGFTIANGNANGVDAADRTGAGMFNVNASPTIKRCTFQTNKAGAPPTVTAETVNAGGDGAGMYNSASSPLLSSCSFIGNTVTGRGLNLGSGGGMESDVASSPTLKDCTFSGNSAGASGGAVLGNGSFVDCEFTSNSADKDGGATYTHAVDSDGVSFTRCEFSLNTADGNGGGAIAGVPDAGFGSGDAPSVFQACTFTGNTAATGGGLYVLGQVVLSDCTFTGNTASTDGGGLAAGSDSELQLSDCQFVRNHASDANGTGGGIDSTAASLELIDCLFTGNSANEGGGFHGGVASSTSAGTFQDCIFVGNVAAGAGGGLSLGQVALHDTFNLLNCTLIANTAATRGGGIVSVATVVLRNSIIRSNVAPDGSQIKEIAGNVGMRGSDFEGSSQPFELAPNNIDAVPQFLRNPAPGNDAQWGTSDDDYGNLQLAGSSPCIDVGENDGVAVGITKDFAGNARLVDAAGVHDPGAIVDMGALEYATGNVNPNLAAPTSLVATDGQYIPGIALAWDAVEAADGYKIYRGTINDFNQSVLIGSTTSGVTSFSDTNVRSGTLYYYWAAATAKLNGAERIGIPGASDAGLNTRWARILDNVLVVYGTGGDDSIFLQGQVGNLIVKRNGSAFKFNSSISGIRILAGDGNDKVVLGPSIIGAYIDGENGYDSITGGSGNDSIYGGNGKDRLIGGDGNDRIDGGASNDLILGGIGDDSLTGGDGNDRLEGEDGRDRLSGGTGNDILLGGDDADTLFGDDGADSLDGGVANDRLIGGGGIDTMRGSGGKDLFYARDGLIDIIDGGDGVDAGDIDRKSDVKIQLESLFLV